MLWEVMALKEAKSNIKSIQRRLVKGWKSTQKGVHLQKKLREEKGQNIKISGVF